MTSLEFPWQFAYRYDAHGRHGPFLTVGLQMGGHRHDLICLVDTGAERTLLDGQHLRAAGIDLFEGRPVRVGGFLGSSAVTYEHIVTLTIEDFEVEMAVLFSSQPLERAVLGRDALKPLRFALREGVGELYLGLDG